MKTRAALALALLALATALCLEGMRRLEEKLRGEARA